MCYQTLLINQFALQSLQLSSNHLIGPYNHLIGPAITLCDTLPLNLAISVWDPHDHLNNWLS
jgi:hypothetical protein